MLRRYLYFAVLKVHNAAMKIAKWLFFTAHHKILKERNIGRQRKRLKMNHLCSNRLWNLVHFFRENSAVHQQGVSETNQSLLLVWVMGSLNFLLFKHAHFSLTHFYESREQIHHCQACVAYFISSHFSTYPNLNTCSEDFIVKVKILQRLCACLNTKRRFRKPRLGRFSGLLFHDSFEKTAVN